MEIYLDCYVKKEDNSTRYSGFRKYFTLTYHEIPLCKQYNNTEFPYVVSIRRKKKYTKKYKCYVRLSTQVTNKSQRIDGQNITEEECREGVLI